MPLKRNSGPAAFIKSLVKHASFKKSKELCFEHDYSFRKIVNLPSSNNNKEEYSSFSTEIEDAVSQTVLIKKLNDYIERDLVGEEDLCLKSYFQGVDLPPISLQDYLLRLVCNINQLSKTKSSEESSGVRCAIMALIYLERISKKITPRSIHRYLMTALLIALKVSEDFAISNQFWGDVGGCRLHEVNQMEQAFCNLLDWKLHITSEEYKVKKGMFTL